MQTEKVGFIGLGNMGHPMAKNLEKAGVELCVYNRTAKKAKDFTKKTTVCQNVSEVAAQCGVVFTMLTDDASVKAVYDEILGLDISGKLFVDISTISQNATCQLAQALQTAGASFIDAPVTGSIGPATDGTLIFLAGGDEKDLQRAQPYFDRMGKAVKHFGCNGKGIAAKLAINYYLSIIYHGLAETVLFAEKMGIGRADMLEIINESASGSVASRMKTAMLVDKDYKASIVMDLLFKDIQLARKAGADYPLSGRVLQTFQAAHDSGMGHEDIIAIIKEIARTVGQKE